MQIYYNFIPVQPSIFLDQDSIINLLNYNITNHSLISVRGLPGSGKSSLIKAFAHQAHLSNNILWFEFENSDIDADITFLLCNKINELFNEEIDCINNPTVFIQALEVLEKHKVVLVLDNLLLPHNSSLSSFFILASKLLSSAKVIISSESQLQIPSINLTDVCEIQPNKLSTHSSEKLISQLCKMHNSINIEDSKFKEISNVCYGNPLAIKTFISYVHQQVFSIEELFLIDSEFAKDMKNVIYQSLIINLDMKEIKLLLLFQLYQYPMSKKLIQSAIGEGFHLEMQSLVSKSILESNLDGLIQIAPFIQRYLDIRASSSLIDKTHLSISNLLSDTSLSLEPLIHASHHALLAEKFDLLKLSLSYIASQICLMGPEIQSYQDLLHKIWSHQHFDDETILCYIIDSYLYLGSRKKSKYYIQQLKSNDLIAFYKFKDLHFEENTEQSITAFEKLNLKGLSLHHQIDAYFLVSKYYFSIADSKCARQNFDIASSLCKSNPNVFSILSNLNRAQYHFNFQESHKSQDVLEKLFVLLDKYPNSKTYMSCILLKANILVRENNLIQAETILDRLIKTKPCEQFTEITIRVQLLLASIYCIQTHYHKALNIYQSALSLSQNAQFLGLEVQILSHLSISYSRVNRFQEALVSIEKAIQLAATAKKTQLLWLMNIQNIGLLILLNEIEIALEKLEEIQTLQLGYSNTNKTYLYFYYAKAYQVKKDQKNYEYYWQKYQTHFHALKDEDQQSSQEARSWFESKILEINKHLLVNQSHQETYSVNFIELRTICSDRHNYQVFFCSEAKKLFVNQNPVDIFSKRILLPLLMLFIQSPKATFSSEELINTVWEEPVSQKTKDKLRVTMLRLCKMLNRFGLDVLKNPKKNQFCFNDKLTYCLIFNEVE